MNISFRLKIIISGFTSILIFGAFVIFYFIPLFKNSIIEKKKEKIREISEVAISILDTQSKKAIAGEITEAEAKSRAVEAIQHLRWGPENKDYLWINDYFPNMIMHPYRSDLDGKDISQFADPNGKKLFSEMAEVCKKDGQGFVHYMWQWKDDEKKIVPKISYVKAYTPWKWIVGTGIYIEDVNAEIRSLQIKSWIVLFSLLALSFILLIFTSNKIASKVAEVSKKVSDIAEKEGDLTSELEVTSRDELGELTENFNRLIEKIHNVILNIRDTSHKSVFAAEKLKISAEVFSGNAQEQAASMEEISAAMEHIASGMQVVAKESAGQSDGIRSLYSSIGKLSEINSLAAAEYEKVIRKIEVVNQAAGTGEDFLNTINLSMQKIFRSSEEVGKIVTIIRSISEKTNLLSLNAAIEAARAGEAGKGFAIVAQEITKLADQTASSIQNISRLIQENKNEIGIGSSNVQNGVGVFSGIIRGISEVNSLIEKIQSAMINQSQAMGDVTQSATEVNLKSEGIRNSTSNQKHALDEVTLTLNSLRDIAQQFAVGAESVAQSSVEINEISDSIRQKIEYFKLKT